jgi:chromosome segregation ATPase
MPDDHTRAWNRFSADFKVPDSEDAARVANEVKASIDTWVQNSLADLQADMTARMQAQLSTLQQNIVGSQQALASVDSKIAAIRGEVDKLVAADPSLKTATEALNQQIEDTRAAMQAAADKWEQNGKDALATAVGIAKTVATFA